MPSVSPDLLARPLAVLASRVRYEEKLILAELDRRGVSYQVVDPRRMTFRLDRLDVPWRGALAREISHHRSLYAARVLEHAAVPVVNSARAIAVCGDKLLTTLALDAAGLPVPPCLVALAPEAALDALGALGYPAVVKPLVGSWGRQVVKLNDRDAAEAVLEHRAALPDPRQRITYAQQYIDKPGRDIRGLMIGDEVAGAVYRIGSDWRTGTRGGARTALCPLTDDLAALFRAAAAAVGEGVYGIDVLEDRDGGLYVCEINHTPEFHGAAEVLSVNIAGLYADYVLRRLAAASAAGETAKR
jgi:[lysine-biosynthesis-protein LysW]--L-2-aminoadipate ligase